MAGAIVNSTQLDQLDHMNSLIRSRKVNFDALWFEEPRRRKWEIPNLMFFAQPTLKNKYYSRPSERGQPNPIWVTSKEGIDSMMTDLNMAHEFCVRVREYHGETRTPVTTWLQFGTWDGRDYLVEAMRLQKEIESSLKEILENPQVLKIMIDREKQIQALQRDFHIFLFPCADVVQFGIAGNKNHFHGMYSFDSLCSRFAAELNVSPPDMSSFLHAETATFAQMDYATHEVHLGLRIFNILRDRMDVSSQRIGFERSLKCPTYEISSRRFNIEAATIESISFLAMNNIRTPEGDTAREMTPRERSIFRSLVEWRELISKAFNLRPEKVMTDLQMLRIAKLRNVGNLTEMEIWGAIGNLPTLIDRQKKFLTNMLRAADVDAFMKKNRETVCNQCCQKDHGPVAFCFREAWQSGQAQKHNLNRPELAEKKTARVAHVRQYHENIKKRDEHTAAKKAEIESNPFFKAMSEK